MTHIAVKELSAPVRDALKSVGYGAADIEVIPAETVSPFAEAGQGARGFTLALNVETGARELIRGSWGGSNMFTATLVDDSQETVPMPANGVVIKGQTGYPRTFARIYAHPNAFGRLLPAPATDAPLSDEEQQAIYCFAAIKGGQYRRDELRRRDVSEATVDALVDRGYLKRSKNGATAITTKGKNARTVRY